MEAPKIPRFNPETIADPRTVDAHYEAQRLRDNAASGFGVAQLEKAPTGQWQDEAEQLSGSLLDYTKAAWHVLEPATVFKPNWHIDAICDHLEAVTAHQIRRLIINVPPGASKSLGACVFWPTWQWTHTPWFRWLFSSYGKELATRDSLKSRRLIQSSWYQARWGHLFRLTGDQNVKSRFENDRTGYRIITSVDSGGTGERGNAVVVDDPHNVKQAESDAKRIAACTWWSETMSTRLNDPDTDARVVIMQRVHQHDVTGDILARDLNYEHLMIPMEYEKKRAIVTGIGWKDPRTKEGELMWIDHFTPRAVKDLKKELGAHGTAGQLQQRPTARKGGQFERASFKLEKEIPKGSHMVRVRFWDKAGTEGGGKYTAGVLISIRITDGRVWVEDVVRGQWAAGNRERIIRETAELDAMRYGTPKAGNGTIVPNKEAVLYVVEQEPGSGGKDSAQATVRNLAGYRVKAVTVTGDKFTRADPFSGAVANKDVTVLINDRWTEEYLDELEAAGPGAAYLDQMDASSGAYNEAIELYDARRGSSMQGLRTELLEDTGLIGPSRWEIT